MELLSPTTFKLAALLWHCFHNSVHILLLRYSRARNIKDMYFSSVAVFFTEVVKIILCFIMVGVDEGDFIKYGLKLFFQHKINF